MAVRKTIVGTNTSLNGNTSSSSIEVSTNPANSIVNNLNVKITGTETKEVEKQVEATTSIANPYENIVKYPTSDASEQDKEIYMFLMKTFQSIIISDPECVTNIIDQSGLVVLSSKNLIKLISMVCEVKEENVKIEIEDNNETGCCGLFMTILPLKQVRKIKVLKDGQTFNDFQLSYNSLYNKIIDEYKVSLENVYVKII